VWEEESGKRSCGKKNEVGSVGRRMKVEKVWEEE
jgi:hypothetical protein